MTLGLLSLLFFSTVASSQSIADALLVGADVSLVTGGVTGEISSSHNKAAKSQKVGGAVVGVAVNYDVSNTWATFVSPQIAVDAKTRDVVRKGIQGAVMYHLMGGSKRVAHSVLNATVTQRRGYNLSILAKSGYFTYTARDPEGRLDPIEGSVIENSAGLDFRYDVGESASIGTQVSATVIVMPASVEGLRTKLTELLLYWRTYF